MQDFVFKSPTEIVFGRDVENRTGEYLKKYGAHHVFVHYGGGSAKKSGLLDRVLKSITDAGLTYVEMSGVQPNPLLSMVRDGIELCRREKVDFLLAVGGGSVIDSTKAIGIGLTHDGDVWDFFEKKVPPPQSPVPTGVVLTIPAAGSEASRSIVITNENGLIKRGFDSEASRPVFALMNPELTYTLPAYQTAAGISDMMAHIMERYFTNTKDVDLTGRMCEALLRTIISAARTVVKDPKNYEARANLMWASTIAHNDLLSTGRVGDWASHRIEHQLSAIYGVAHGAGLAVIFPAWMKYVYKHDPAIFCQFGERVFDIENDFYHPEETALKTITALESFFKEIGMPVTLGGLGITDNRFEEMAGMAASVGEVGKFVKLSIDDIVKIYELAV